MSRVIKFRAWDKNLKRMIKSDELFALDCSNELPFLAFAKGFYNNDPFYMNIDEVVMQFTGLYDKNGKEINESFFDIDEITSRRSFGSKLSDVIINITY